MKVEEIEEKINKLQSLKQFLIINNIKKDDSIEEIIFKKYLELENVSGVTEYVNKCGFRIKNDKGKLIKYTSNDISSVLSNKKACVDAGLKDFVNKLFNQHKKGNGRRFY